TPTPTSTYTLSPTAAPSPTVNAPPSLSWIPDLQIIQNQPVNRVLDLNQYVYDPDTFAANLIWSIEQESPIPTLKLTAHSWVSVENPTTHGIYSASIHVSDGCATRTQEIKVQVLPFLFRGAFYPEPWIVKSSEKMVSKQPLYEFIEPAEFPREQIAFEIPSRFPRGIRQVEILDDGRLCITADQSRPPKLTYLPILARYVSPTPTAKPLDPTPTVFVASPTPVVNLSPIRTPTVTPLSLIQTTMTPTPETDLELRMGDSCYSFSMRRIIPVGRNPMDLTSCDINHDGKADFLTADFDDDTATVLISGAQEYEYQKVVLSSGGAGCLNVLTDDLDQDGWEDIILLNAYDSSLRIYWGDESLTFSESMDLLLPFWAALPSDQPHAARMRCMAAGSFLSSTKRHIAVSGDQNIAFYTVENDRSIQFVHKYLLGVEPIQMLALDLNQDGVDELALTHNQPCFVKIYSCATHPPRRLLAKELDVDILGDVPYGLISGIFNQDGAMDAAVYTFSGVLHIGYGDNAYDLDWNDQRVSGFIMKDMNGGDFNGDGVEEIILAGWDRESEQPCLALVDGTAPDLNASPVLNPIPRTFPLNQIFSVSTERVDDDRLLDLVLADRVKNQLVLFSNCTRNAFEPDEGILTLQPQRTVDVKKNRSQ
ncbi:MAG: FG-GAP repeat domain-containing protein, partial [Candidatus Hinthialibacter sp.]